MRDMGEEMEELRDLLKDSQRGSRDEAIRNRYPTLTLTLTLTLALALTLALTLTLTPTLPLTRYHGTKEDLLAEKYLDRARKQAEPTPP